MHERARHAQKLTPPFAPSLGNEERWTNIEFGEVDSNRSNEHQDGKGIEAFHP